MGEVLFEDAAREFLAHHSLYSEHPETMASQMRVLGLAFSGRYLSQIVVRVIEAFIAARLDAGVSRATLNRNRSALSALFRWAIVSGYHPGPNPVSAVRRFRESAGRTRYLTAQEADRIVLAASPHLKPLIVCGLHTGGRLSELLALTWGDVDFTAGSICFRRETTKARKTRNVPMSDELRAALLAMRRGKQDEPVFTWNERPIKRVRTAFARACEKAGVKGVTVGVLRHSFASHFIQRGGSIAVLQDLMGHSDPMLTRRYAHLSPDAMKDALKFIGPARARKVDSPGEIP